MPLPLEGSTTQTHLAQRRIRNDLLKFAASQIAFSEDVRRHEIRVSFVLDNFPVSVPVNCKDLAELYFGSADEESLKRATRSAWAALEQYIKSNLIMHELGIMDITEIFLPSLVGKNGLRFIDSVRGQLKDAVDQGKLLIPERSGP